MFVSCRVGVAQFVFVSCSCHMFRVRVSVKTNLNTTLTSNRNVKTQYIMYLYARNRLATPKSQIC